MTWLPQLMKILVCFECFHHLRKIQQEIRLLKTECLPGLVGNRLLLRKCPAAKFPHRWIARRLAGWSPVWAQRHWQVGEYEKLGPRGERQALGIFGGDFVEVVTHGPSQLVWHCVKNPGVGSNDKKNISVFRGLRNLWNHLEYPWVSPDWGILKWTRFSDSELHFCVPTYRVICRCLSHGAMAQSKSRFQVLLGKVQSVCWKSSTLFHSCKLCGAEICNHVMWMLTRANFQLAHARHCWM